MERCREREVSSTTFSEAYAIEASAEAKLGTFETSPGSWASPAARTGFLIEICPRATNSRSPP